MTLPKRRGYNLRRRSPNSHSILENSQEMECPRQPAETTATSTTSPLAAGNASTTGDSGYFSPGISLTPTGRFCPPQTRSSTWVASLRSLLFKQKPHRRPQVVVPPGLSTNEPQTEEQLDRFLAEVWEKDVPTEQQQPTSPYVQKVTELKDFYVRKQAEISQREATFINEILYHDETTPLITADELNLEAQLKKVLLETQVSYRYDDLRFTLKQEVAQTILSLRAHYIRNIGRHRRNLCPKATKIMNQWFECHLDHPYPTEQEKRALATQGGITMEQVSNWFSNKRCRSKSLKTFRGRKRKAGSSTL